MEKYTSIRLPSNFIQEEVVPISETEHRSIPQQIMHWARLGREAELREWQLAKIRSGLEQYKQGMVASDEDVSKVLDKCK